MAPANETREIIVPAGYARCFYVEKEECFAVTDVEGQQVADFIAFNADDLTEFMSTSHTIISIGRLIPKAGDQLRSNRRSPMLQIIRDDVGCHDLIIAACDPWRYLLDYGINDHRNCSDNFLEALQAYGLERHRLPNPVNLFQNVKYHDNGQIELMPSLSKAGDQIVFRALMNLVAAISACPMDLNPINGYRVTDIKVTINYNPPPCPP